MRCPYLMLICLAGMVLTACGFEPVHGTKPTTRAVTSVKVADIPGKEGHIYRYALEDMLHPAPHTDKTLRLSLKIQRQPAGIGQDRRILRLHYYRHE